VQCAEEICTSIRKRIKKSVWYKFYINWGKKILLKQENWKLILFYQITAIEKS
jgi:hypothetical protein